MRPNKALQTLQKTIHKNEHDSVSSVCFPRS